jgi:polyisoprenoid-binding protein YceI
MIRPRKLLWTIVPVVCVMVGAAGAQAIPAMSLRTGVLAFDGNATLGDFTGTTSTVTGAFHAAASIEGVRGWVEAPARTLVTGNGRRDRDMYSSLEVAEFPTLRFDLDDLAAGPAQGDSIPVTLRGRFTLHGVTRPHAVPGWLWLTGQSARFKGRLPLNLKDYQIGGLSKMLGVLKMQEEIVVRIDVMFAS